jgi:hypothetical protein
LRGGGGHGAQEKRISECLFLRRVDLNGYYYPIYFLLTFPTSLRMWLCPWSGPNQDDEEAMDDPR